MNLSTDDLIHRYFDGLLSAGEFAELNRRLKSENSAALRYAEIAQLHQALNDGFSTGTLEHRSSESSESLESSEKAAIIDHPSSFGMNWKMLAASVVLIASLLFFTQKEEVVPEVAETQTSAELQDSGYAVLTRVVDADWQSTSLQQGDLLGAESFSLKSGLAQIEFLSGVSLVVEGDAEFEIISSEEMHLHRGKLRAHVPEHAIGFQIHTPRGTALDLGTEFALDLSDETCELHVLDGEVEWHPNDDIETLVTGGKGLRVSEGEGKTAAIAAEPDRFTSPNQLASQFATRQEKRFLDWQKSISQLDYLVAHFPFSKEGPWNRQLTPSSENQPVGSIVAAEKVIGRWPGKEALDFSPNGSRVRVTVPGEFSQITFATWARIDSLDRQFNALFLTDNYESGEPHWQLTSDGRLFFSIRLEEEKKLHHIHYSPRVWDHSRTQQWLHLVTTYDTATRTAVHYLNGEEIARDQAPADKAIEAIRIGNAQIGNWGLPTKSDPGFAVRNLNGRLDEFAIFSAALSPAEVQSLYQSGKP